MKLLTLTITILTYFASFAQNKVQKETAKIVEEGKLLYKSEMASWYGTDLFLEKFAEQRANLGGYFSYSDKHLTMRILLKKRKPNNFRHNYFRQHLQCKNCQGRRY